MDDKVSDSTVTLFFTVLPRLAIISASLPDYLIYPLGLNVFANRTGDLVDSQMV